MASALYLKFIKNEPTNIAAKELRAAYGHVPFLFPPVRKYDAAFFDLAEKP